jgi:tetratricopeptide (TPR) repeat protein/predicted Ser/Thr protein kinase
VIGRSLSHFHIDAKLGSGGMGVVYRATDTKLRREIALKVLPESVAADDERRRRFLREARAAAAVTHNNIATVHEVGEADGYVFIAMELVEGESLRERLRAPLPHREALRIARQIARGLARAHEKGVVHRDLKPENVMITPEGDVKILDFGLAKLREVEGDAGTATTAAQLTEEGSIMGTPAYMSPEQAEGRADVDARSDVFSLGVMLYEMLAGERPFQGSSGVAILAGVLHREPLALEVVCPDAPTSLVAVVVRCMKKARADRFASGRDVLIALEGDTEHFAGDRPSGGTGASSARGTGTASPSGIAIPSGMGTALGATVLADAAKIASGAPETGVRARGRSVLPWVVVVAMIAAGALWALVPGAGFHAPVAAVTSASASSAAPPPAVTTLTDLPPPPTKVPEAASEYAAAMQALRDNNWFVALKHLERVAALDPSIAAGHLRLSMCHYAAGDADARRAEFARALTLRSQLSPRDQALLEALEPLLQRSSPDPAEASRNLESLTKTYPLDTELLTWLGTLGSASVQLKLSERIIALDPKDGNGWEMKGRALESLGRTGEAREAYARCAAITVDGADCPVWITMIEMVDGHCDAMAQAAQTAADRSPPYGFAVLSAMVATGKDETTIRENIQGWAPSLGPDASLVTACEDAQLALVAGDFDRVRSLARTTSAQARARASYRWSITFATQRVEAALEMGDAVGASGAAQELVARAPALGNADPIYHGVDLLPFHERVGSPQGPETGFERWRQAWLDARVAKGAASGPLWTYGYAATAFTPAEAVAALAVLPKFVPLTPVPSAANTFSDPGLPDAFVGHTYLLAGDVDGALPYLKRAAASCALFNSVFSLMHASLDLGKALETKRDKEGACSSYRRVLAQWGHAKPRSVTADEARKRATALGCAK